MATNTSKIVTDTENLAQVNKTADDGLRVTSATRGSPIDTPVDTTLVLATNATSRPSISKADSGASGTRDSICFTDLPQEIVMMIIEILFERHQQSRIKLFRKPLLEITKDFEYNVDMSIFAARRVNQATKVACRRVFLKDTSFAQSFEEVASTDHQIKLEEEAASAVLRLEGEDNDPWNPDVYNAWFKWSDRVKGIYRPEAYYKS